MVDAYGFSNCLHFYVFEVGESIADIHTELWVTLKTPRTGSCSEFLSSAKQSSVEMSANYSLTMKT